jgi:hypothetical protein
MRPRPLLLAAAVLLTACAEPAPPAPDHAAQERTCAAVVAEHVGMQPDQVSPVWDHATPEGTAVVNVSAPGRPHSCEISGLRVLRLDHIGQ